jgi:aminopeptidase 2
MSLVWAVYGGFSSQSDLEHAEKFYDGRDTSKYNMALAQTLDSIRAKVRWIEVRF